MSMQCSILNLMNPKEIQQIESLLSDVYEGLCEGDELATMQLQYNELNQAIRRLMDATFEASDQATKVRLASLVNI